MTYSGKNATASGQVLLQKNIINGHAVAHL